MEILHLTTQRQLDQFIAMADRLYRNDKNYVPFMRKDLKKTLKRLVLTEKTYTALAVTDGKRFLGRLLFTVAPSKQLKLERCGFFSHFECIDDQVCADLLLGEMCRLLKEAGVSHVEGSYFPYDQDNRRGILAEGFRDEPMILTSYNPAYYPALLEKVGFSKDFDTLSFRLDIDQFDNARVRPLVTKLMARHGLVIEHADFSQMDREIDDVHTIIRAATDNLIFQEAPSREDLVRIVKGWKNFLWPDLIFICRKEKDRQPVGFVMGVPNYYTVFRKMKGKTNPIALLKALYYRKRIRAVRAILQYVIPEYQGWGVNYALYEAFYETCRKKKIRDIEAGTVMENNTRSRLSIEGAGGVCHKVFRLYGREL